MFIKKCFFIGLLILSVQAFAMPSQIIIFPHADKEIYGPHLSIQGVSHAQMLKRFILHSDMYRPNIVIANSTPQQRALGSIETCQPIANSLNASFHSQFLRSQAADMMAKVLTDPDYDHKKILICWDKRDIPTMKELIIKANKSMQITILQPSGYVPGYLFN